MNPYQQTNGGMPPQFPQGQAGYGAAQQAIPAYPPYPSQPGMLAQFQQPIRLARYSGDALHGGPPLAQQQQQQYQMQAAQFPGSGMPAASFGPRGPLQPQLNPVGRPGQMPVQPMAVPQGYGGFVQQPQYGQPVVAGHARGMSAGGSSSAGQYSGSVLQQGQQRSSMPPSAVATLQPVPGSGMATPAHPHQPQQPLTNSGSSSIFLAQPIPAPPGIVLPDSLLSPGSPGSLRQPVSPGSRVQSASAAQQGTHQAPQQLFSNHQAQQQQLVPLGRGGSRSRPLSGQQQGTLGGGSGARAGPGMAAGGGGFVDLGNLGSGPLRTGSGGLPPKGLSRAGSAGSAHSLANSTRGGGMGGGPDSGQRQRGGLGSGSGGRLGNGGGKGFGSAPASRVGSAGKKNTGRELNEYDNIKVAVRVRPPNAQELARADQQALFINPNDYRQIQLAVPAANGLAATRTFTFHACLSPTSRQQDVIRLCGINQLLDAALDGFNTTIMAYGQTGSGKTYTMSGHEDVIMDDGYLGDTDDGIMTRSAAYLFEQMQRRNDGCKYTFRVSYLEIYNEAVYDLLKFDKKQLQVRWDAVKGFHVPDLFIKECGTLEDLLKAISRGMRHRRVGSHELNLESSRSHSIMTIYCDCTPLRADDHEFGTTRYGKVSLVDLAGSERVRDSKSSGETLKETTNINRSLFMLGKVIAALAEGAQGARVPYRESKLTRLLMDSLGGSSLSLVIACCSPSAAHVEETLSTLTYASRAKNIRNQPIQQVDPQEAAISALKRELRLLRSENAYLREQLFQANMPRAPGTLPPTAPGSRLPTAPGTASGHRHSGDGSAAIPAGSVPPSPFTAGTGTGGPAAVDQASEALQGGLHAAASGAPGGRAGTSRGPSRPPSASAGGGTAASAAGAGPVGAALSAAQASSITSEELLRRLLETQRMLVQFSKENDRLSGENDRLRAGKNLVATDYQGALEEVEWLRTKLESLETSLLRASLDATGIVAAGRGGKPAQQASNALAGGSAERGDTVAVGTGSGREDGQPEAAAQGTSSSAAGMDVGAVLDAAMAAVTAADPLGNSPGASPKAVVAPALQEAAQHVQHDVEEQPPASEGGPAQLNFLDGGLWTGGLGEQTGDGAAAAAAAATLSSDPGSPSKAPLIAPELLQDPSELTLVAGPLAMTSPGQDEVSMASVAPPAAATEAAHTMSSDGLEGGEGLLPAGEAVMDPQEEEAVDGSIDETMPAALAGVDTSRLLTASVVPAVHAAAGEEGDGKAAKAGTGVTAYVTLGPAGAEAAAKLGKGSLTTAAAGETGDLIPAAAAGIVADSQH